jgi:hypothetical protein
MNLFSSFEKEVLQKVFSSVLENGFWRKAINSEIYKLHNEYDVTFFELLTRRWTIQGLHPCGENIFRAIHTGPETSSYTMSTGCFSEVKRPWRVVDHPVPSSAEVANVFRRYNSASPLLLHVHAGGDLYLSLVDTVLLHYHLYLMRFIVMVGSVSFSLLVP